MKPFKALKRCPYLFPGEDFYLIASSFFSLWLFSWFIYTGTTERWFRLSGNLLFYLKTKDFWSEPMGLIVLENYSVKIDPRPPQTTTGFYFVIGESSLLSHWKERGERLILWMIKDPIAPYFPSSLKWEFWKISLWQTSVIHVKLILDGFYPFFY